jgi:membrane dipeptidase
MNFADYVGLGSDFDGVSGMAPDGMEDVSKYPALVKGLIDMGYSDSDIRKVMGENLLRVMRANEAVARDQRPGRAAKSAAGTTSNDL